LMRLYTATGQPFAALTQYQELERILADELSARPSAAARQLAAEVERLAASLPVPTAVSPSPAARTQPEVAMPVGTVTFLLTEIVGAPTLMEQAPEAFQAARNLHHTVLRREFRRHGGSVFRDEGEAFAVAFTRAGSALACAVAVQRALEAQSWPETM